MKMDTKNTNVVAENVYQTETFTQSLQTDVGLRKTTVTVHFEYDAVLEQYFVTAVLSNGRKPKIYEGSLHAVIDSLKHEKIHQHWLDKLIISFFNKFQPKCVNKGYEPYSIDAIHESALGQKNTCRHASIRDFRITSNNDSKRIVVRDCDVTVEYSPQTCNYSTSLRFKLDDREFTGTRYLWFADDVFKYDGDVVDVIDNVVSDLHRLYKDVDINITSLQAIVEHTFDSFRTENPLHIYTVIKNQNEYLKSDEAVEDFRHSLEIDKEFELTEYTAWCKVLIDKYLLDCRIDEIDDYLDDVKKVKKGDKGYVGLMLPERIVKEIQQQLSPESARIAKAIMKEIQKLPTSDEVSND